MPDFQILLLPKAQYWDWVAAAKDYVIQFGVNLTSDPDAAGRYMIPQQTVTIAGAPDGYPGQGDIQAWFTKNYPSVRVDYVPARTPAEFQAQLARRLAAGDRYAPVGPDFRRLWPPGVCLAGVHGRSDGALLAADFHAVAEARLEAVKLLSSAAAEDYPRLLAINPQMFVLVRLMAIIDGFVPPEEFVARVRGDMGKFYRQGVRYFEVHNEANLKAEGWTRTWQDGREFAQWFLAVRNALKAQYPEAKFGWPGLSPDGFPMPERTNDMRFLDEAADAVRAADWIGVHCYWRDEAEMRSPSGGLGFREYRRRYPDKLLFITEFSNPAPNVDARAKGEQYATYYQLLRHEPGVGAAFAFVLSASANFPHEAWRFEDGTLSEIVSAVGRRAGTA